MKALRLMIFDKLSVKEYEDPPANDTASCHFKLPVRVESHTAWTKVKANAFSRWLAIPGVIQPKQEASLRANSISPRQCVGATGFTRASPRLTPNGRGQNILSE